MATTNTFKYGTANLTFTEEAVTNITVKVSDGTVLTFPNTTKTAVTPAKVLAEYNRVKGAYVPPVVVTPTPPIVTFPDTPVKDTREVVKVPIPSNKQLFLCNITDKKIVVSPGTLEYLNIGVSNNLSVELTGVDMPNGTIDIDLANGLEIFGATIHDHKYRPIGISGISQNVWIHNMTFRNIANYCIKNYNTAYWDGTDKTTCKGWRIENNIFDNTSTCLQSDASFDATGIKNLMKDLTIANNVYVNSPYVGDTNYIGACDGYNIYGNAFSNINGINNNDNGGFHIIGWGSMYNNTIRNSEGYIGRLWPISFGTTPRDIKVYGNLSNNIRKYSLVELQTTDELKAYMDKYPSRVTFVNAEIYKNTASLMSTSKDWVGTVAVIYNTYGKVNIHDNVGVELFSPDQPVAKLWFGMNNPALTPVTESNNVYYPTKSEAIKANSSLSTLLA